MEFMKKIIVLPVLLVCLAGCGQPEPAYELKEEAASDSVSGQEESVISEEMPKVVHICAYICGAVQNPGVYTLLEGSRVVDLVAAAGGMLETADGRALNLAKILQDGEQITVYTCEEAAEMPGQTKEQSAVSLKVNLNTADISQLMTLSGIGEARAQAIITYREQNGKFERIEDIMNIEGIKEKMFEKIKEQIEI